MLVPISWLKDYVDITIPVEKLAERLTLAGLEVAHINYIGLPQQVLDDVRWPKSHHLVWDRDKLLLGAIREVKQHPDADKLVLAMVDYGGDELEQCVTGAPNLYAYADKGPLETPLWTAFALEGAEVWDGHSDTPQRMILEGKELRGIYNKSMVCSEKELGISNEHEGVIILEHNDQYVPGTPLQDVLGDIVLDIELTPNLGHAFSVLGVAREVAALTGVEVREPDYTFLAEGAPIDGQVMLEIHEPELNPRFVLALLKETTVKASPEWMQRRLKLVGQRPINNFVDVTNYITFEIGQPLHAYDYDKLVERANGNAPKIITRLSQPDETLETLDEIQRNLGDNQIMVCDEAGILGFGGLIGGAETEISETTKTVLLEGANWNFINIRRTAHHQKIFTEAGTRFSRNIHPSRAIKGVTRGIELMRQLGGGIIAQGLIDDYPLQPEPVKVELPLREVHRLTGITDITIQQAADVLSGLLFDVTIDGEVIHATVPDYRTDISEGVIGVADLVEEIARIIGYDRIPDTIMDDEMPEQRADVMFETEEMVRDYLTRYGLNETISYRLTTPQAEQALVPQGAVSSLPDTPHVTIINPSTEERRVMRRTILVSLLENATRNARFQNRQQLFEIGSVYLKNGDLLPDEPLRLGLLMTGQRDPLSWQGGDTEHINFYDMKGVIENLLADMHIGNARYIASEHTSLHPGRSAALLINGEVVGNFGELHPLVALKHKLGDAPVFIAELDLSRLIELANGDFTVRPIATTPPVLEDIALVVNISTAAADVEAVIRQAGGDLLRDVRLFDVYTGESIGEGKKNLAYSLTYQSLEETLSDKQVKKIRKDILKAVETELGAQLRS